MQNASNKTLRSPALTQDRVLPTLSPGYSMWTTSETGRKTKQTMLVQIYTSSVILNISFYNLYLLC